MLKENEARCYNASVNDWSTVSIELKYNPDTIIAMSNHSNHAHDVTRNVTAMIKNTIDRKSVV